MNVANRGWFLSVIAALGLALAIPLLAIAMHNSLIDARISTPDIARADAATHAPAPAAPPAPAVPAAPPGNAAAPPAPWATTCNGQPAVCHVEQTVFLKGPDGKAAPILRISVGHTDARDPRLFMTLLVPPGISRERGVAVQIDSGPKNQLPVRGCDASGCQVAFVVDQSARQLIATSRAIQVGFFDGQGREVSLPVGVGGLDDAMKKVAL